MKIIVDADACPRAVLEICLDSGKKHNVSVWTVASVNHNIKSDHHIMVDSALQEADIKVANLAEKGDVVVTGDWGLAAVLTGKKVVCLNQDGLEYRPENMEFMLELREFKAKYRRRGGRTRGPKKRTAQNDLDFKTMLEKALADEKGLNGIKL